MVLIKVCMTREVPPGTVRNFNLMERTILVANLGGRYYAVDGLCSHGTANLANGTLSGDIIRCPRHFAEFDLRTGKVVKGPEAPGNVFDLRSYPIQVKDGCLHVDI